MSVKQKPCLVTRLYYKASRIDLLSISGMQPELGRVPSTIGATLASRRTIEIRCSHLVAIELVSLYDLFRNSYLFYRLLSKLCTHCLLLAYLDA